MISKGYLRVQEILEALEWDRVDYVNDKGFQIQICMVENLNVHGRNFAGTSPYQWLMHSVYANANA